MAQDALGQIDYPFEEVPLDIGTPVKPQRIALITGTCTIKFSGDSWDIVAVSLSGPIKDDPDVELRYVRDCQTGSDLWKWVTESIARSRGDAIVERLVDNLPESAPMRRGDI